MNDLDFEKALEEENPEILEKIDLQNEIYKLKTSISKLKSTNKALHKQKLEDDKRLGTVIGLKDQSRITRITPTDRDWETDVLSLYISF